MRIFLSATIRRFFFVVLISGVPFLLPAQIDIPAGRIVKENFNTIGTGTGLPANWKISAPGEGYTSGWATAGNQVSVTMVSSSGNPTAGGSYNWGTTAGTDRAVGFMTGAGHGGPSAVMAQYRNMTGSVLNSLTISYQLERYRVNSSMFQLELYYSTNGSSWAAAPGGAISGAVMRPGSSGYLFSSPSTVYKAVTINGLNILHTGSIFIKWVFVSADDNASQGLGIDNIGLTANPVQPDLASNLEVSLTGDVNGDGQANPGDILGYTGKIRNSGSGNADNVSVTLPPPANTSLSGTVKTSALARDDSYSTGFNTVLDAATVLANDFGLPSLSVVSFGPTETPGAIPANGTNTASSDNGGTVLMNADGTFSYTAPVGFTGIDKFSYTASTGTGPGNTAIVSISAGSVATAVDDSYNVSGNISVQHLASSGIRQNDGGQGAVSSVNGSSSNIGVAVPTSQGGTVTVQEDGSFIYNPPPGFEGTDQFIYTADNGFSAESSPATVTLSVSGMIWFINNAAGAAGDGRLSSPFNSLAAFAAVNNGSGSNPSASDNLFIYSGSGDYTGGITLLNNQKLIGQGATASLASIAGITLATGSAALPATGGANPVIVNAGGNGISLAANNTLRGLTIGNSSSVGISGSSFGTLNLSETSVSGTGQALGLSNGTLAANFTSLSSSSGTNGIVLTTTAGTLTINGGTISGQTGHSILVNGGTVSMTCAASISQSSNASLVSITNHTTGSISFQTAALGATNGTGLQFDNADGNYTFSGTVTLNGGDAGVDIINGSSGNFSFINTNITNPSGTAFFVNGGGGSIGHAGTISKTSSGRLIDIQSRAGGSISLTGNLSSTGPATGINVSGCSNGTVTFSGASKTINTGANTAVTLSTNGGATINFSNGGLAISTTSGAGFNATGGATGISVTGSGNTINSGTGIAVNVSSTTIGAGGLNFQSISHNGGTSGIVLNNTGGSGGLTVTGTGTTNSGGTIQNTSSHGINLTSTISPSFNNIRILNSSGSGIKGNLVTDFSCTNSSIDNSGTGLAADASNIAFNTTSTGTEQNITGVVTITGNTLTNSQYHGIDLFNFSGTISQATISNNTLISRTSAATSQGSAIRLIAFGSASTTAHVTRATISTNTLTNWPGGVALQVQGGNNNAAGSAGTMGVAGHASDIITISNNIISGQNATNRIGAEGILTLVGGRGQGNFAITGNQISHTTGTSIGNSSFGLANVTSSITGNTIISNNTFAAQGIGVGVSQVPGIGNTASLTVTVSNNNISQADGNGILAVVRDCDGTMNITISNNNVAAPLTGVRPGIRVDAGNATGNATVCLSISGNTSAGSSGTNGIGLRKQGTNATVNRFGITGIAATSSPGIETYVQGLNPAGNGVLLISATSGFTNCTL